MASLQMIGLEIEEVCTLFFFQNADFFLTSLDSTRALQNQALKIECSK